MGACVVQRKQSVRVGADRADVEIFKDRNGDHELEKGDEDQHAHFAVALHFGYLASR